MLTATLPRPDEAQLEHHGLLAHISTRLHPAPTASELPRGDIVDDLGRTLTAATLPVPQREAVLRLLRDSLLDNPPPVAAFSISRGLAAMGFVLQDASRSLGETIDLTEVDDLVLAALGRPWLSDLGLSEGLAGMAVYGLVRAPEATGIAIVEHVVEHLLHLSQMGIDGTFWPTAGADPEGAPTVGLARGGAGVVSVLLAVLEGGFVTDVVRDLIEASVPWILDNLGDSPVVHWGCGPLGPLTVVVRAGTQLGRPEWTDQALAALERLRPHLLEAPVSDDPSLGRGSGGTLVLLQSLAQHLPLPWVQTALRRWHTAAATTCLRRLRSDEPIDWSLDTGIGGTLRALQDDCTHARWRMLVGAWERETRHG